MTRQVAEMLIKNAELDTLHKKIIYGFIEVKQSIDELAWIFNLSPHLILAHLVSELDLSQISVLDEAHYELKYASRIVEKHKENKEN